MSSLKKRATWGMVISAVCLVAGIALISSGYGSIDHAFQTGFAEIEKISDNDLVKRLFVGMLPSAAGIVLAVLGFVLFPVFLAVWIRNPPAGSKLTFRGWKMPEERTTAELARDEAWKAINWGLMATQTWVLQLCFGGFRILHSPPPFVVKMLLLLAAVCVIFYALGIRLCRRRDPASVAAAHGTWKLALAVNYGGLFVFLILAGIRFFLSFRT